MGGLQKKQGHHHGERRSHEADTGQLVGAGRFLLGGHLIAENVYDRPQNSIDRDFLYVRRGACTNLLLSPLAESPEHGGISTGPPCSAPWSSNICVVTNPAPEPVESDDEASEMDHFEETFRKLLKVPKSEVDEMRKKERR